MYTSLKDFKNKYKKINEKAEEVQPEEVQPETQEEVELEGFTIDKFKEVYKEKYNEYLEEVEDVEDAMDELSDEQLEFLFNTVLIFNEEGEVTNEGFFDMFKSDGKLTEENIKNKEAIINTMKKIDEYIKDGKKVMFKTTQDAEFKPYNQTEALKTMEKHKYAGILKLWERGDTVNAIFHIKAAWSVNK